MKFLPSGGTMVAVPSLFRLGNPALSGSRHLVTPYYCRLFIRVSFICILFCVCVHICILWFLCVFWVVFLCSFLLQYFDTVGWVFWPVKTVGHITYIVSVQTLNHAQSINQFYLAMVGCILMEVCQCSGSLCHVRFSLVESHKAVQEVVYLTEVWEISEQVSTVFMSYVLMSNCDCF